MPKREYGDFEDLSSDDDDDEGQKTKKQKPKKPAAKRPAKKDSDSAMVVVPTEKKPQSRPKKLTSTEVDELGWTCVPPSLIHRDFGSKPSAKIAGFDLDGTLVNTKSGADFARGPDDWKFFNKQVPIVLKKFQDDGYKVVIFSNQGGVKSALTGKAAATVKGKVEQMLKQAGVSAQVLLATGADQYRKPDTGMWDFMCKELTGGVQPDKSQSFYVGDAAGRPTDFKDKATGLPTDTDKRFAESVGISFKLPEDVFGTEAGKSGLNTELITIFKELTDHYFGTGDDKAKFKAIAFRKVVSALSAFEEKITAGNLKAVNALPGVGKGSMGVIKEYVETGKVQELEDIRAAKGEPAKADVAEGPAPAGPAGPKSAAAAVALKFM